MTVVSAECIPGEGTTLQVEVASTMTTIAQVMEVNGVATSVAAIDKTVLTSTVHITRPSKLPKPEEASIKILFDPSDNETQNLITGDIAAPGTVRNFLITFNDSHVTKSSAAFSGFFTKFELNGIKVEENIGADVSIQLTTLVTWTAGADS